MTTGTDYMVVWHSPKPKIVGYSTTLEGAERIMQRERLKHKMWVITIYKELEY